MKDLIPIIVLIAIIALIVTIYRVVTIIFIKNVKELRHQYPIGYKMVYPTDNLQDDEELKDMGIEELYKRAQTSETLLRTNESVIKVKEYQSQEKQKRDLENAIIEEKFGRKYEDLIRKYPHGTETFKSLTPSYIVWNKSYAVQHIDEIKKYEKLYSTYIQNKAWEINQNKFSDQCTKLRNQLMKSWGLYSYEVQVNGKDEKGKEIIISLPIQHIFSHSFCSSTQLDYTDFQSKIENRKKAKKSEILKTHYNKRECDTILNFISQISSSKTVIFHDKSFKDDDLAIIEKNYFSYLKQNLKTKLIDYTNLSELTIHETKSFNIIVIDLVTSATKLNNTCKKIFTSRFGKHCNIVYITMFKEHTEEEMYKLIERKRNERMNSIASNCSKKFLFFDTETTGVPDDYDAPSSDTDNWPRLVQLSWIITDEKGKVLKDKDFIIKPDGFDIPIESSEIHGITTSIAKQKGDSIENVLNIFLDDFAKVDVIVGHNISFDKKIIGAELIRLDMDDIMDSKTTICTMLSTVDFCKIDGYYGYKWPKLQELHKKLFGHEFEDAHNSAADIEATKNCFWELVKRGIINI